MKLYLNKWNNEMPAFSRKKVLLLLIDHITLNFKILILLFGNSKREFNQWYCEMEFDLDLLSKELPTIDLNPVKGKKCFVRNGLYETCRMIEN